jgi:hypothetical protein
MPVVNLGRCLRDPNLFARHFRGASSGGHGRYSLPLFLPRPSVRMTSISIARTPGGQRGRLRRFGRLR